MWPLSLFHRRGAGRRLPCRPALEVLEDRAVPAVFTVTNLADAGPGSLREAIGQTNEIPNDADTIVFQPGLTGFILLTTGQLAVTGPVSIIGPGSRLLTIHGNIHSRIFQFDNNSPSLDHYDLSGVTLTGGIFNFDEVNGGAIEVASETLFLRDVVIEGNRALDGGGIFVGPDGFLLMDDCTVDGNFSDGSGGGIFLSQGSTAFLRNSTIFRNDTESGHFVGHTGGGIFYGGGPGLSIQNSTISDNTAADSGGGIRVFGGPVRIVNSTIAFNTADSDNNGIGTGGGISVRGGIPPVTLESTIVADNAVGTTGQSPDISGEATADHCLVRNRTGTFFDAVSNSLLGFDPRLGPLDNNRRPTWPPALPPGSPATPPGSSPGFLPTDQRGPGFLRTAGPGTDTGAFEVQPLSSPLPLTVPVVAIQLTRVKRRTRVDVVADGDLKRRYFPFGAFKGRVKVARVDVNGDGALDLVVRALINGKRKKKVYDGVTLAPLPPGLA